MVPLRPHLPQGWYLIYWRAISVDGHPVQGAVVPRFSNVAFVSVLLLLGTGTWATINHMPALDALWLTGHGVAILVKIGLLITAMALGAFNLLRTKPRLLAAASTPKLVNPPRGYYAARSAARRC